MEMKGLQPVMAEDTVEELVKGRNQAGDDGAHEEGVKGAPLSLWGSRAGSESSLPHLAALRRRHQAREGEILLCHVGDPELASTRLMEPRPRSCGAPLLVGGEWMRRIWRFRKQEGKSKKGDLEQDE